MSISPERGQGPYLLSVGFIQIAGQSQSPLGIFARVSTVPYVKLNESSVTIRAEDIGLMISSPAVLQYTKEKS